MMYINDDVFIFQIPQAKAIIKVKNKKNISK